MTQQTTAPRLDRRLGEFAFPQTDKVIVGADTLSRLPDEVDRLGCSRVFVVTGNSIATRTPLLVQVQKLLGGRYAGAYTGCQQHAPSRTVLAAAQAAEGAQADLIIGLGGGSPIDTARACARMLAQETPPSAVAAGEFFPSLSRPLRRSPAATITISTTLSAADFSSGGGITDERDRSKFVGYGDPRLAPRVIFLDPLVTLHTPMPLWMASGMRAVDHAVESLYSRLPHPVVHLLGKEALRLLTTALPRTADDPSDVEARAQCQLGCWLSFFSPASLMIGPSHALGHQLGSRCDVPHGVTSSILLPHVMRFLAPDLADRMLPIAEAVGVETAGLEPLAAALAAADAVADLVKRLGLPGRLQDAGVAESDLEPIAGKAFAEGGAHGTPRAFNDAGDLMHILRQAW